MNKNLRHVLVSTALVASSATALADPILWVSDSLGRLETIDVITGNTTLIGTMGIVMFDIAFSPSGQLYGIDGTRLYTINSNTGATTLIGGSGGGNLNSLVFGSDGSLYGASTGLYKFDVGTGARALVGGTFAGGATSSGDLAFVSGNLYLSTLSSPDRLQRISTVTGANTDIGSIGFGSVFGLASPNSSDLYGFSGTQVLSINVATGAGTVVSTVQGNSLGTVYGSAFRTEAVAAIPEPETYALMLAGLGVVGWTARRRAAALR